MVEKFSRLKMLLCDFFVDLFMLQLSQNTIHTVAVGPEVDEDLEMLANRTRGRHFHHSDFSTALFDVFSQLGFDDTRKQLHAHDITTVFWF